MGKGSPPSSIPLKVRLNPDELNLRLLVSFTPKASPPQVRVEVKLLAFILAFCKKARTVVSFEAGDGSAPHECEGDYSSQPH
jgi:hypothetical protein